MNEGRWFIKKCSTSVLAIYLLAIIFLIVMIPFDDSIVVDTVVVAISTGGLLIVAGDLLCSPFGVSSTLRSAYKELSETCQIHELATNTKNRFIVDEKINAVKRERSYVSSEKTDITLFYIGNILKVLGFSFLVLVFASTKFYGWISSVPSFLTIVSFVFLVCCMLVEEYKEYSLEKIYQKKEMIMNIASSELQRKHQPREGSE